ncbi:MAG TPA: cyclic nucleotide-binding domain-containing protein [Thermomicrobiales bacterium]|nr:cyclic nucleotide-binding domain-containing protein [Thermomicrobiales bacterium]
MVDAQRSRTEPVDAQVLRKVALFADLPDEDLAALAAQAERRQFAAGAILMRQGDPADALYLVESGRAEVVITPRKGEERVVGHVGAGDPVGELGLLTGEPRTATVRAAEPIVALVLRRDAFAAAMEHRGFAGQLAKVVAGRLTSENQSSALADPPLSRVLFSETRLAWVWLLLRVWVGYQWLESGIAKVRNPAWMSSGLALRGFWQQAVAQSAHPLITYDWYRSFIEFLLRTGSYAWFGKVIALGETFVGLGLILGCLTGLAATGGLLMNVSYLLAGSASINPVLAAAQVPIILAWKVAGWWGLDRWVLAPALRRQRPAIQPQAVREPWFGARWIAAARR